MDRFFIDCEFDGHNGSLLSFAIVADDGRSGHFQTTEIATDPWVIENVMPIMDSHDADMMAQVTVNTIGSLLREFIGVSDHPVIVADSPVDIARFCHAYSTGEFGGYAPNSFPRMTFEVHDIDCYPTDVPGAVQHNAYWDAMALRHKIHRREALAEMVRLDQEMGLL